MSEHTREIAELVSLALTSPTIIFGGAVVALFARDAWASLWTTNKRRHDYLILGIFVGFLGGVIDNAYWAVPWSLSYIESPLTDWWMRNGVFWNVWHRQIAGTLAAFCHIAAAMAPIGKDSSVPTRWRYVWPLGIVSVVLGVAFVFVLNWIKAAG